MSWHLARWKPCDGGCCVRSPRFPRPDGADCVYHLNTEGEYGGCALIRDTRAGLVIPLFSQPDRERFAETCLNWPPDVDRVYDDADVTVVDGHVSINDQAFHVEHDWTEEQLAAAEPACCYRWEPV